MKSKNVIVFTFFLLFALTGFAQTKNVAFFKFGGREVNQMDSADYIRVISDPDSGSTIYNVNEYYRNKSKKLIGKTSKADGVVYEGQCVTFYQSGKKESVINYQNGKRVGDEYIYYPNGKIDVHRRNISGENNSGDRSLILDCRDSTGKVLVENGNGHYAGFDHDFKKIIEDGPVKDGLKDSIWNGDVGDHGHFVEVYSNGSLKTGKFIDGDNKTYTYTVREVQPQFPGGIQGFSQYLSNNIKYPYTAKLNHTQGRVIVTFVVERDGSLTDLKVVSSPSTTLSGEAVRVLQNSPAWVPGYQYGRKVRVSYAVPVNFVL